MKVTDTDVVVAESAVVDDGSADIAIRAVHSIIAPFLAKERQLLLQRSWPLARYFGVLGTPLLGPFGYWVRQFGGSRNGYGVHEF